jgi:general stress protein YciG
MKRIPTEKQLAYWQRMQDTDGWRKMASEGGRANVAKRGPEGMAELGQKGGEANVAKHGTQHMSAIGHEGGEATKKKYGKDHFRRLVEIRDNKEHP